MHNAHLYHPVYIIENDLLDKGFAKIPNIWNPNRRIAWLSVIAPNCELTTWSFKAILPKVAP